MVGGRRTARRGGERTRWWRQPMRRRHTLTVTSSAMTRSSSRSSAFSSIALDSSAPCTERSLTARAPAAAASTARCRSLQQRRGRREMQASQGCAYLMHACEGDRRTAWCRNTTHRCSSSVVRSKSRRSLATVCSASSRVRVSSRFSRSYRAASLSAVSATCFSLSTSARRSSLSSSSSPARSSATSARWASPDSDCCARSCTATGARGNAKCTGVECQQRKISKT